MKVAVFDIEGDDLYEDVSTLHCAWVYDVSTDTYWGYPPNRIHLLADDLNYYDVAIGHNVIGYDAPVLAKFQGEVTATLFDTLVAARLFKPDMIGGHSLKKWGQRTGTLKTDYSEPEDNTVDVWAEFNWEMYWYCKDDVKATVALLNHMIKKGFTPEMLVEYMNEHKQFASPLV